MDIIDLSVEINDQGIVLEVNNGSNNNAPELYNLFCTLINDEVHSCFPELNDLSQSQLYFMGQEYNFDRIQLENRTLVLFKKANHEIELYKKSLNQFEQGVQIYDANGTVVFFNDQTKKTSNISHIHVEGKHLLDLYDVDPNYSTILTTLNNGTTVTNRCDTFTVNNGKTITTLNSGVPLIENGKVVGAVLKEWSRESLSNIQETNTLISDLIYRYSNALAEETKNNKHQFDTLIGQNSKFLKTVALARKVAVNESNVMLLGETGSGKELFAQCVHNASPRKNKKFVPINCAAVPENLIESILFGTAKGAFTGSENKSGLFKEADGGTLFLDELNSMSPIMQSKLLRVIETGHYRKVGETKLQSCDVRIISCCNEHPLSINFRKDLFYRLSAVFIEIPPLRERIDDLELLMEHFLKILGNKYLKTIDQIEPDVLNVFRHYKWEGNIRELLHVVEYALNVMDTTTLTLSDLPERLYNIVPDFSSKMATTVSSDISSMAQSIIPNTNPDFVPVEVGELEVLMQGFEEKVIRKTLQQNDKNISKSAEVLGIKRQSLQYRLKKYGIIL